MTFAPWETAQLPVPIRNLGSLQLAKTKPTGYLGVLHVGAGFEHVSASYVN
jgi:hypothetical protein